MASHVISLSSGVDLPSQRRSHPNKGNDESREACDRWKVFDVRLLRPQPQRILLIIAGASDEKV